MRRALPGLVLLLTLAVPPAAVALPLPEGFAAVNRALESYRLAEARALLQGLRTASPPENVPAWLEGKAAFFAGDYLLASRLLDSGGPVVFPGDPGLAALVRDTASAAAALATHRSEHFVLLADDRRDWILVDAGLEALERARASLGDLLGDFPEEPLRVEIYPDADSFQRASSLTEKDIENSGAIGICKFNKIMVLSPRAMAYGYRWRDTLVHEYVHYLVVRLTANQAPIWVHEGISRRFETAWRGEDGSGKDAVGDALLAEALAGGSLVPFDRMDPSLVYLDGPREVTLAYAQCASAMEFIWERGGRAGLTAFLAGIRTRGKGSTREALRETIGLGFDEFQAAWKGWLGGRGLRPIEGLEIPGWKLAGKAGGEDDFFAEVRTQGARNHVGLGDKLRAAGRHKAALLEYRRALKEAPASAHLLARAAIAASLAEDHAAAAELLERGLRVAPDYPLLYRVRGDGLAHQGKADEALAAYREYIELNPFDPGVHRAAGELHRGAGRNREALEAWETARRLGADDDTLRREMDDARRDLQRNGG